MRSISYSVTSLLIVMLISMSFGQSLLQPQQAQLSIPGFPSTSGSSMQAMNFNSSGYAMPGGASASQFNFGGANTPNMAPPTINLVGEEDNYVIGAGDQLTALVWTTTEEEIVITISSSGRAIIPNIGSINVQNYTLAETQDTITNLLSTRFRNAEIDIFLSQAKQISVPVYGEVITPGVYVVDGTTRLTEIIALAGGITDNANPRQVEISNEYLVNNDTLDLYRAYRVPSEKVSFVQSGDKLFVPPHLNVITLSGAVNYPDKYDFIEGETVAELIATSGGFTRRVDSTRILVTRFINDLDSIVRFELSYDLANTFALQADDYIFVPEQKDYRVTRQVTITGEVTFPGQYAVREDKTHLIDLIGLAGGLTDDAYLAGSWIERTDFTDAGATEYYRLRTQIAIELSPDERNYLKYRSASPNGRVSIDFEDLLQNGEELNNIILRNGDEIHIARRGLSVNVMGAVINPGLITFQEGEDLEYYINQAGGYQDDAERRRVKVIKGGSGTWLEPRQVDQIEIGDAIWIPEEPYIDRLQRTRTVLAIVGSIAGVIMAGLNLATYIEDHQP